MNESEPYLSARELAKRWRMPIATLRQWRWLKKGPPSHKVGGRPLYYLKDVEAFEEAALRYHTTMDSSSSERLF